MVMNASLLPEFKVSGGGDEREEEMEEEKQEGGGGGRQGGAQERERKLQGVLVKKGQSLGDG